MSNATVTELSTRAAKGIARALCIKGGRCEGRFDCRCPRQSAEARALATPARASRLTAVEILETRNCGQGVLQEVREWLARHGLALQEEPLGDLPRHYGPVAAHVYADWLEEHGEPAAAAKLRAAFPLEYGRPPV